MVVICQQPDSFAERKPRLYIDDMKTTLAERLKLARKERGLSQKALGELVGVSQAAIQKIETEKAQSTNKILELAQALNVTPEWLNFGDGPMQKGAPSIPSPGYSTIKDTGLKTVVWEDLTDEERSGFIQIPLLDVSLSAGHGMCALEERSDFSMPFDPRYIKSMGVSESAAKLVRVSGQSMSPVLNDGDIVGVNTNDIEIRDGKTYAICQADLLRVKMLIATPDSVIIRSINREEYPDEIIPRDKFHDEVRVIGKVFWSAHSW